ncbi:histidine phosphatase family protein [Desertibacillus haloalkaliphilus]|uniref:histidine phosphatase family protein n=1 Tax=Desertibacillus haloalkaliphilus TaxID=1328930 RepID=UPI001FE311D1|nr:histidine phosphatase family protein [Desertibacillus haloalkaliphilus]
MDDRVAITLLRHGLTKANEEKRYLGWSDVGLSEKGRKQLQTYATSDYPTGDLYLSSDLLRCVQTLEVLYPHRPYDVEKNLRECHFGNWELKTYHELKHQQEYRNWLTNPSDHAPINGEGMQQFNQRVTIAWQKVISYFEAEHIRHLIIVTHGGVIRALLSDYAPVKKEFWEWEIGHGKGYTLIGDRQQVRGNQRCTLLQEVP